MNWKYVLTAAVFGIVLLTIATDYTKFANESLSDGESATSTEAFNVKAAMLALAGAATLFIRLIPSIASRAHNFLILWLNAVGALAALSTGWFWLLGATGGRPGPYLIAVLPTMGIFAGVVIVSMLLRRDTSESKVSLTTLKTLLTLFVVALSVLVIFAFLRPVLF